MLKQHGEDAPEEAPILKAVISAQERHQPEKVSFFSRHQARLEGQSHAAASECFRRGRGPGLRSSKAPPRSRVIEARTQKLAISICVVLPAP